MKRCTTPLASLAFLVLQSLAHAGPSDLTPSPSPSPSPSPKIITSYSGMLSSRYDVSSSNAFHRLQDSVVLGFTVSPSNGYIDLVGMLQTGSIYGKRYQTVLDFKDPSKNSLSPTLFFKHLYLQKSFKAFGQAAQAQAGVIGTNQRIGTQTFVGPVTAIGTNSWIDGGRLSMQTRIGDLSVTSGSIYDAQQPEILKRERKLNYFEVQMSRKVFDRLILEASGGKYDGEIFVRGAVEYDMKIVSGHLVRLIQEGFYSQGHLAYSTAISTDLGAFLDPKLEGRINIDLRHAYNTPATGFRAQTMNDLTVKGHVFTAALYGKVDRDGRLNWFTAKDLGDIRRYQAGVNWKFKGGNKH